jgi:hypothetical protein
MTKLSKMVSPSHISPLLMCSDTFEVAVIYLAVGRPIQH